MIKKQLAEIEVIRPVIIVLLLMVHSFAIYTGYWSAPQGVEPIRAYFWIGRFAYSFMLETFVFVSGYLFAFQIYELNKKYSFKKILKTKLKRLILPSIVFSLLYLICFTPFSGWLSINSFVSILSGKGHLWFLPMLFWCFIETYFILKIKLSEKTKLILLFIFAVTPNPLPFQIGNSFYYLFFFYLAIFIYRNKKNVVAFFMSKKRLFFLLCLFFLLFIPFTLIIEHIRLTEFTQYIYKIIKVLVLKTLKITYATVGLLFIYSLVSKYTEKYSNILPSYLKILNRNSMGIYIYHQFILIYIYYETSLSNCINNYCLPIFALLITLFLSIILSSLTLKTKIGRYLIG